MEVSHSVEEGDQVDLIKEVEVELVLRNKKDGRRELSGRGKSKEILGFLVWPQLLFPDKLSPVHSRLN